MLSWLPVLRAGHRERTGRTARPSRDPRASLLKVTGRSFPNAGGFVVADREHARCVVRKGCGGDPRCVAAEDDVRGFAGLDVPQSGRAVVTGGQEFAAVGREFHCVDKLGVPAFEFADRSAGLGIPNLGRRIPTAGGDQSAIGRKGRRSDAPCGL